MAFSSQTLVTLIVDAGALEAHQGDHAPQEDVDLLEVGKFPQNPAADQPVIRMVEYHLSPHPVHQTVEAFRGEPLEEGVRVPLAAHAVDHLAAV